MEMFLVLFIQEKCEHLAANKEEVNKLQMTLEKERESLRVESRSLGNLRAEHSKLKVSE